MKNKKFLIITLAVIFLIILGVFFCFKSNLLNNNEENMPELEEVQVTIETPSEPEAEAVVKTEEVKTPAASKPAAKPVAKPEVTSEPTDTKADEKAVKELEAIEKITEKTEPSNVVIIDQEYKMKSKDKYTFK